ncbi:MAG TPA: cell envelope integrity protein TolA [Azospirillaceae bacterium]|nr:cell envelope integrity protein TolA [Azospirillaceae bacterium]
MAKLLGDVAKMKPAPSQAQTSTASKTSQSQSTAKPSGAKTATPGPEREFKPSGRATDAIRSQLSKLWNVDTGRRSDGDMKVVIHVEVGPDGSVLSARMDDASLARASSDRAYRASAEAAVRAVLRAQKLNLLPDEFTPATYQNWRKFVFTFDPRDMF